MLDGAAGYAVFMGLALVTALVLRRFFGAATPLTPRQRLAVGLGAFAGGVLAAKVPYVLFGGGWLDPGKTILAGMAGGYLGVEVAKLAAGVRVKTGDGFAVPVAAAVAVGRLGCFANGCCGGAASSLPWAFEGRHPTQLYEVLFHAAMAVVLWRLWTRGTFKLQLLKLYFAAYGVFRFGEEFLRTEPRIAWGLTAYQWASMGLIALMSALGAMDERRKVAPAPA